MSTVSGCFPLTHATPDATVSPSPPSHTCRSRGTAGGPCIPPPGLQTPVQGEKSLAHPRPELAQGRCGRSGSNRQIDGSRIAIATGALPKRRADTRIRTRGVIPITRSIRRPYRCRAPRGGGPGFELMWLLAGFNDWGFAHVGGGARGGGGVLCLCTDLHCLFYWAAPRALQSWHCS